MNFLTTIYMVAIGVIGFIAGMVLELFVDNNHFVEIEKENEHLKAELAKARTEPEVIEIVDPWSVGSKAPETDFEFPSKNGF